MTSLPPGIDLSTISLVPPPSGMSSNFVDPESLANIMMPVEISMLVSTVLVVIVRLLSNHHATRGLGWDDCCCVIATVLFLIYVVISLDLRLYARHEYDVPIIWITPFYFKKQFVGNIAFAPMIFFAKSSLFILYYRLFKPQKFIRYAIIFLITFSFLIHSSNMTFNAILCSPKIGHPWNLAAGENCVRTGVFAVVLGSTNLILDIFLLILPVPVIVSMQLSVKKKVGTLAVFMAGLFAFVASIITLIFRTKFVHPTDSLWNGYLCQIWITIETGLIIICSSTAALVAFWKSHMTTYVAPLCSHLSSRYSKMSTRFMFFSRASSDNHICSPKSDQPKSHLGLHNLNYVELDDHHQEPAGFPGGIVRTKIGSSAPRPDVENGVI